jgi:hypothetical protein
MTTCSMRWRGFSTMICRSPFRCLSLKRMTASWTANSVSPAADQTFAVPTNATNLPQTASFFGIGTATSGAGVLLYSGAISPTMVISNTGSTPIFSATSTITED